MEIAKEESRAYKTLTNVADLANALRRHVAAEMQLEFRRDHSRCAHAACALTVDPRHNFNSADWDRAAHEALMQGS